MIGLNKKAPISRDPGTIFEFLLPNPPVWFRCQPDMVRCDGCLSDGQKTAVQGDHGGQRLHFVDFVLEVPQSHPTSMPILTMF